MPLPRQRLYAAAIGCGIGILLVRTIVMLWEGSLDILVSWAGALLVAEFLIDLAAVLGSVAWFVSGGLAHKSFTLRAAAAAIVLHAVRVLTFVLGRVGPWIDFDVRPEHRALHPERWSWGDVYFASAMALLSIVGLIIIWRHRRRSSRE